MDLLLQAPYTGLEMPFFPPSKMQFFCQHVKHLRLFDHKTQWFKITWNCVTHSYLFLLFPHTAIAILHKLWAQLRQIFQPSSDRVCTQNLSC